MAPKASKISSYAADVLVLKEHVAKLHQYTNPDLKSYARVHNLPYYRLYRMYKGGHTRSDRRPPNTLLSEEQDLALERYMDAIDAIGYGVHRGLVEQQANAILAESYTGLDEAHPQLGKHWARRWLQRHPKYRRVKAKPMEIHRKLAQEPEALRSWYDRLEKHMKELGILPEDIYNMDETGCRIGVATNQYVYSKFGREIFIPSANNRELVTLVECVSAAGWAIPPMIIIKAATIMENWVTDLPDDHLICVSDSGYSNDSLALE